MSKSNEFRWPENVFFELSGLLKVKLRNYGIRIIYKLEPPDSDNMRIIIIGMRSDGEVYESGTKRI